MIARHYRLREREITRVFKRGRPSFGKFWTLYAFPGTRPGYRRVAVAVSKKYDKRAVARNACRRRTYDGLRGYLGDGSGMSCACVLVLRKGILHDPLTLGLLVEDAQKIFEKTFSS